MYDQTERELKVLLTKDQYEQIKDAYEWNKTITQRNVYFDDDKGTVRSFGSMRIRTINGKHIFTLKVRLDPITLKELEKATDTDDVNKITDPEILSWMKEYHVPKDVHPIAESLTKRMVHETDYAELCLDQTDFGKHRDYELEYEYKEDHDGLEAFRKLISRFGISYEKNGPSKIARALQYQNL